MNRLVSISFQDSSSSSSSSSFVLASLVGSSVMASVLFFGYRLLCVFDLFLYNCDRFSCSFGLCLALFFVRVWGFVSGDWVSGGCGVDADFSRSRRFASISLSTYVSPAVSHVYGFMHCFAWSLCFVYVVACQL